MPTVNVDKEFLFKELGRTFETAEFEDLCFEFGIELEEETSLLEMATREVGAEKAVGLSDRGLYRIDIPANRIDLLCAEGLARALKIYLGIEKPPIFKTTQPSVLQSLIVKPELAQIRPFVVGAVLRNVTFDEFRYESFIELQEKLHNNICRKRTLVAIGTHDLDTVEGPFTYAALKPEDIQFIPLNQTKSMNGKELMEFYQSDRRLSKFLPIIRDHPLYPVILDAKGRVCSLPPIINGDHSKIKLTTKNVLIECTATDLNKAKIVLNTVVTMFSQYCKDKFSVEPVNIVYADHQTVTPDLSNRIVETSADYLCKRVGVKLNNSEVIKLLGRMGLLSQEKDGKIFVTVPPTRSDILHACDIAEDVAIGYGFNNVLKTFPRCNTIAAPFPLNKLSDQLRLEVALSGFTEVLPLILCSHDENFAYLRKQDDGTQAVKLANPKTVEYQVVRTSLIPGMLKTIQSNRSIPLPMKLFEVSDVVFKNDALERRARNQRNFCAIYCGKTSGFEVIHGLLDRVMKMLNISNVSIGAPHGYYIQECEDATFFKGRTARIYLNQKPIGTFGILHPEVLKNFDIANPCSVLEMTVEPFV